MYKSINDLAKYCHEIAASKGFWEKERNVGETLMLIVSEIGEAMEAHQKGRVANLDNFRFELNAAQNSPNLEKIIKKSFEDNVKDSFSDEMADAVIRILDLCGGMGIDLASHIQYKLEYNQTREYLHGKIY